MRRLSSNCFGLESVDFVENSDFSFVKYFDVLLITYVFAGMLEGNTLKDILIRINSIFSFYKSQEVWFYPTFRLRHHLQLIFPHKYTTGLSAGAQTDSRLKNAENAQITDIS